MLFNGVFVFANNELKIELIKETKEEWSNLGEYPKKDSAKLHRQEAEIEFREAINQLDYFMHAQMCQYLILHSMYNAV